jgi:hypothetical protein
VVERFGVRVRRGIVPIANALVGRMVSRGERGTVMHDRIGDVLATRSAADRRRDRRVVRRAGCS